MYLKFIKASFVFRVSFVPCFTHTPAGLNLGPVSFHPGLGLLCFDSAQHDTTSLSLTGYLYTNLFKASR